MLSQYLSPNGADTSLCRINNRTPIPCGEAAVWLDEGALQSVVEEYGTSVRPACLGEFVNGVKQIAAVTGAVRPEWAKTGKEMS